jgi:hypothetical protein
VVQPWPWKRSSHWISEPEGEVWVGVRGDTGLNVARGEGVPPVVSITMQEVAMGLLEWRSHELGGLGAGPRQG